MMSKGVGGRSRRPSEGEGWHAKRAGVPLVVKNNTL